VGFARRARDNGVRGDGACDADVIAPAVARRAVRETDA
jgi:hypothetical protein